MCGPKLRPVPTSIRRACGPADDYDDILVAQRQQDRVLATEGIPFGELRAAHPSDRVRVDQVDLLHLVRLAEVGIDWLQLKRWRRRPEQLEQGDAFEELSIVGEHHDLVIAYGNLGMDLGDDPMVVAQRRYLTAGGGARPRGGTEGLGSSERNLWARGVAAGGPAKTSVCPSAGCASWRGHPRLRAGHCCPTWRTVNATSSAARAHRAL